MDQGEGGGGSSRGYSFKGSLDQGERRRRSSRGYSFKGSLDQGEGGGGPAGVIVLRGAWTKGKEEEEEEEDNISIGECMTV